MKPPTTTLTWPVPVDATATAARLESEPRSIAETAPTHEGLPAALRWVGLLAVGQMLLFVIMFLFLCARAGADAPLNSLELRVSEYAPQSQRDPFGVLPVAATPGAPVPVVTTPVELKLQGILYHATRPAALINDKTVELNKPVTVKTAAGEVPVRALEITREIVLLEVGGQKLELRLGAADRNNPEK